VAEEIKADEKIDITNLVCPNTFVKTKVVLDELDEGQILEVRLNGGEPVQNVPRSLKEEGHKVLSLNENDDGTFTLFVEKVGD
jgi:TusA-related sulfurtransferase